MNTRLATEYRRFRESGMDPKSAIYSAKTLLQWQKLDYAGLVRLRSQEEEENYFSVYGEPDTKEERDSTLHTLEVYGCWYVSGEYRVNPDDSEWIPADGVGMCVYNNPESPYENCYVPDIMSATIDALRTDLRERCECCRQTRKIRKGAHPK